MVKRAAQVLIWAAIGATGVSLLWGSFDRATYFLLLAYITWQVAKSGKSV